MPMEEPRSPGKVPAPPIEPVGKEAVLQPGDVFLTRGRGLLSRLIRLFTRSIGESRTQINHVGLIVAPGSAATAVGVEALSKVVRHPLGSRYGPRSGQEVAVYRPINLRPDEIAVVVSAAESYVGRKYGYVKIVAHLLDWLFLGIYLFRRLARMDNYPICSWLVAHAFSKVEKTFGVPPGAASPDDIWDFVSSEPEKYRCVLPLGALPVG
jgi:hypothetical protein